MPSLHKLIALCAALCFVGAVDAQVDYTANDVNPAYTGKFRPGINLNYLPPWNTYQLGDLSAGNPALGIPGVGARSTRPGLFDRVLDEYGYGLNVDAFDYYRDLGMEDLTAIVGFPSDRHRAWSDRWCNQGEKWNALFDGIYEPIWDDGTDGTPYNEDNAYAAYLYQIVSLYTDNVRFWEIWNEPGLYKGDDSQVFWGQPDYPGSWWINDPDPCDYSIHAPIEHFVRTLRISYEVIKTISPDDYVSIAGVGSQSFLDAILRNTDNPNGGSITPEYPNLGGAYIDVLGFHTYPHLDGSTLFAPTGHFARHSDGAADGIIQRRLGGYQEVLYNYGYDGITYPKKQHICTEINVPRQIFSGEWFGGETAQVNFIGKALIALKINKVHQMHVYSISDKVEEEAAGYEFDLMGLYKKLEGVQPYNQRVNDEGIAYKTASDLIYPTEYDDAATQALQAPQGVRAYAFAKPDGDYVYALWAETQTDLSEAASATYSFPANVASGTMTRFEWDFSRSGESEQVSSVNIALDATPVYFVTGAASAPNAAPQPTLSSALTEAAGNFTVDIDWSEVVSGFAMSDLRVTNGTVSALTGSGPGYSALIKPTAVGPVTIQIPAGAATDLLGKASLASNVVTVNATSTGETGGSTDVDIELSLVADRDVAERFTNVSYVLTVSNTGGRTAEGVRVEMPIPDRMSFVESTASQGVYAATTANWDVGSLAPGQSETVDATFYLLATGPRTAYAQVIATRQFDVDSTPGNGACCTAREDDEASFTINGDGPLEELADLAVTVSSPQANIASSGAFEMLVNVRNDGPSATAGVQVALELPSGVSTVNASVPDRTQLNGAVWSVNRLNVGEEYTLTLSLQATDPTRTTVVGAEVINSSQRDPDSTPGNKAAGEDDRGVLVIDGATMNAPGDLELALRADRTSFSKGQDVTFTLTLNNSGDTEITEVLVHMPPLGGTAHVSATATAGSFTPVDGMWSLAVVPANSTASLDVTVRAYREGPAMTAWAQVVRASGLDTDSRPNNRLCCTPIEDDEAMVRVASSQVSLTPGGGLTPPIATDGTIDRAPDGPFEFAFHQVEQSLGSNAPLVYFTTQMDRTEATLVDALGRVVRTQVLAEGRGEFHVPVDMADLAPGTYTLVVDAPEGATNVRLVHMR